MCNRLREDKLTKIVRPVILTGIGRCGSTLTHEMLSLHPQVNWVSRLMSRFPNRPELNRLLMHLIDVPVAGAVIRQKLGPSEHFPLWRHAYPGFAEPIRDLHASDVTHRVARDINVILSSTMTANRSRLLLKITGWPRLSFLNAVFDDPYFIHVVRDGRAVTNSMINVDWWWGWRGPQNWRWGDLPEDQQLLWEKHDRSFIALAAIEWNIIMDAFERARSSVPEDRYLEVTYEAICEDPVGEMRRICEFCQLQWPAKFTNAIAGHSIYNSNEKWRTELTETQHAIMQDVMGERLARYGYS